jgi:polysaccharide biosynthesis protein PslJ
VDSRGLASPSRLGSDVSAITRVSVPTSNTSASPSRELPAWPVLVLLWGMPAWWALGLMPFSLLIMSVPMAAYLIQRGRVVIVPGTLPWIAFVVWTLPCALMLDSLGRVIGFGVRFSHFVGVAIALVYLINASKSLTVRRVLTALSFTWAFIIFCGYLGMLWPEGELTFTIGRLLPGFVLENEYVRDLVFPGFSEVQDPWGAEEPFVRPSAPFPYANGWGASMVILTPAAIASALERGTTGAFFWFLLGAGLAVPPAVASSNRGLFVGLIVVVAYVAVRLLLRGRWIPFLAVCILSSGVLFLLVASGAVEGITERQEVSDTTTGRSLLYEETFARTLESPVLGFGAPRPSLSSEITVGTQGALWDTMFCFGFVGLALFAWFLIGGVIRTAAAPNTVALWLHSAIVGSCVVAAFYGLDRHLLSICLILGLLLRERYLPSSRLWQRGMRKGGVNAS